MCVLFGHGAAVQMMVQVKMKWVLMLVCIVVCALTTPLLILAHNGMHPHDLVYGFLQG